MKTQQTDTYALNRFNRNKKSAFPDKPTQPTHSPKIKMDALWIQIINKALAPHGSNALGGGAEIVRRYNNVERLAEALRDMLGNPTKAQWDNAHEALAQWEAGK